MYPHYQDALQYGHQYVLRPWDPRYGGRPGRYTQTLLLTLLYADAAAHHLTVVGDGVSVVGVAHGVVAPSVGRSLQPLDGRPAPVHLRHVLVQRHVWRICQARG